MIRNVLCTAAAAASLLGFAGAAHAADARLAFGDLDLSRPEQARVLDQRIRTAAQTRCADDIETGTRLHGACMAQTRDELVAALPTATRAAYLSGMNRPVPKLIASR